MSRSFEYLRFVALLLALVLGSAASARAQYADAAHPQNDFGRAGGYISLSAGGAAQMFLGDYDPGNADVSQAILIGIRGGARVNRWAALEASFDYSVRGFTIEDPFSAASTEARSLTGFGNLKLYALAGRVQPFVFGGAGFLLGALDCVDGGGVPVGCFPLADQEFVFAGRAGGGLDVYLTRHFALSGEVAYVIPTGAMSDLNYLQYVGSLMIRF